MAQTKYTDGSGVSEIWLNIKNYVYSQLLGKADASHTHTKSQITDFPSYGTTANTICEGNDSRLSDARTPTSHTHVKSEITDFPSLATVATSGSYNDLSNKPTIPTVNNATLTIQKNGTTVKTFTANASSNVTANITVPTKTSDLTNDSGFLTSHQSLSGYIPKAGGFVFSGPEFSKTSNDSYLLFCGGQGWGNGASITLYGKDSDSNSGTLLINASDNTNETLFFFRPNGTIVESINNSVAKSIAMQEDVIPRSGGAVITGVRISKTTDTSEFSLDGGSGWTHGATITLYGKGNSGKILMAVNDGTPTQGEFMYMYPDGTWTWSGQPCQTASDQRLKQQITEIDDKLLDAWQDVNLVQFKYNDAVEQKKDNARLHTGYVVQQIDNACKEHGIDISEYGLYCHEEYPQETEEVEVEQADGTKVKETKVIREASEHYSLRYTEVYAVECMYLRRCIKQLTARIEELEKGNNTK